VTHVDDALNSGDPATPLDTRPTSAFTRRNVLIAGGAIGAAGVLAACGGGDGSSATSQAATTTGAAPTSPSTDPTTSSAPQPSPDGTPDGALGPVSAIPVGGGVVYDPPKIVVTQPAEGNIQAFTAVCPHQGCLVTEVTNNEILCPCHGSLFSAETGEVIQGPAVQGLAGASVNIVDGFIVEG
jgi:Rieske Fe-S protein